LTPDLADAARAEVHRRMLAAEDAEFAEPHWVFGLSNYAFLPDGRIVCFYIQRGFDQLAVITPDGHLDPIPCGYTVLGDLTTIGTTIWALGASPTQGNSVLRISLDGAAEAVRHSQKHEMDPQYISSPEAIEFPTENGLTAHALFYRPANKDFAGPAGERPPLIVISHGGPTSAADSSLDLDIQFPAIAQGLSNDVPEGVDPGFRGGQDPVGHLFSNPAVIPSHLTDSFRPQDIGPTVTHMRQGDLRTVEKARNHRGTHGFALRIAADVLGDGLVREKHGHLQAVPVIAQSRVVFHGPGAVLLQGFSDEPGHGLDHDPAGNLPRGMATQAVGHHEQAEFSVRQETVLIVFPDTTDISKSRGADAHA